jgi:hypothetical protein
MSRQVTDLEQILAMMIAEHRKLLTQVEQQQVAMRELKSDEIEKIVALQESTRLRISKLEARRRLISQQLGRLLRLPGDPTIAQIAAAFPQRSIELSRLRNELREVASKVQSKTTIAARLAGAVLGHLNTAVRLIAGAVEQAGVYTKNGTPRVAARIGAIEAVG